jgi:hypothetical protein
MMEEAMRFDLYDSAEGDMMAICCRRAPACHFAVSLLGQLTRGWAFWLVSV